MKMGPTPSSVVSHRHVEKVRGYARRMQTPRVHPDAMRPSTGDARRVATWLGVLALACGRADDAQSSPPLTDMGSSHEVEPTAPGPHESSTGDDDTNDAGASLPSGDRAECPAPRGDATPNVAAGWAREPVTGRCCSYANRSAAPAGWLRFDDEAACESRCLCSALEGFEGNFEDLLPVRDSLECRCSLERCPSTVEEAEQSLCTATSPFPPAVQRLVGCGMVVVADRNGYSGYSWIFEQPSESSDAAPPASGLVGASKFSDADSSDPCPTSSWGAGRDFFAECDTAEVVTCQVCGNSPGSDYPPCQ
jgi:hypothetical protein